MSAAIRGGGGPGQATVCRVVMVCESAQDESLAAEHVAMLVADSGVVIEQPAAPLSRRSVQRRLALQLCSHRHLGRRVLLVRRVDLLQSGAFGRLRKWLSGGQCRAEWQFITYRLPASGRTDGTLESLERGLKPDLLIRLDAGSSSYRGRRFRQPVLG